MTAPADTSTTEAVTDTAADLEAQQALADAAQATPAAMPARTDQGKVDRPESEPKPDSDELAKVRREAANYRTKLREQEQSAAALKKAQDEQAAKTASLEEVLAKLNQVLNPDANQPPDPAKLAEQLETSRAETAKVAADYQRQIRDLTIRAALPGVLSKASADPGLTEAVLTASGALAKLDPSSDTFAADLESAVTAAMTKNPRLKVDAPVASARRSGAEIPGRSGGSDQLTREQVAAMAKIPGALDKARREGRLKNLGVG